MQPGWTGQFNSDVGWSQHLKQATKTLETSNDPQPVTEKIPLATPVFVVSFQSPDGLITSKPERHRFPGRLQ